MKFDFPFLINDMPTEEMVAPWIRKSRRDRFLSLGVEIAHRTYTRVRLSEAQNWKCCYCGQRMSANPQNRHGSTIEHVIPKSKGGSDDLDNLVAACNRCNSARGNCSVEEFMERRAAGNPTGRNLHKKTKVSGKKTKKRASRFIKHLIHVKNRGYLKFDNRIGGFVIVDPYMIIDQSTWADSHKKKFHRMLQDA